MHFCVVYIALFNCNLCVIGPYCGPVTQLNGFDSSIKPSAFKSKYISKPGNNFFYDYNILKLIFF